MRRTIVILSAMLMLAALAVPASAKPDKPDRGGQSSPTIEFGEGAGSEPWAEYQPDHGVCVADVPVTVTKASRNSRVVFAAYDGERLLATREGTIPWIPGRSFGIPFSYDFPCDAEIELEVTHTAVLYDKNGTRVGSDQATHLMSFTICTCEPEC